MIISENLCMSKIVSTRRFQSSLTEPEPELPPLMKPKGSKLLPFKKLCEIKIKECCINNFHYILSEPIKETIIKGEKRKIIYVRLITFSFHLIENYQFFVSLHDISLVL